MSNKQEYNFSVSVDQVDGFGYGGDYLESFIYEMLSHDGYSKDEIAQIIMNGGIENDYHTVKIEPVVLYC